MVIHVRTNKFESINFTVKLSFSSTTTMLAVSTTARLAARGVRRAVVVAGQRQAAVHAVRRNSVRGIQSVAQTDRVSFHILTFFYLCF
jgi:hypothetical protein